MATLEAAPRSEARLMASLSRNFRRGEPIPMRDQLSPEVQRAAITIHQDVWHEPYEPGEGPMHYAGGPYWHDYLPRLADALEEKAVAARLCAGVLPGSTECHCAPFWQKPKADGTCETCDGAVATERSEETDTDG